MSTYFVQSCYCLHAVYVQMTVNIAQNVVAIFQPPTGNHADSLEWTALCPQKVGLNDIYTPEAWTNTLQYRL